MFKINILEIELIRPLCFVEAPTDMLHAERSGCVRMCRHVELRAKNMESPLLEVVLSAVLL